jgi:NADH dehydrogenase
MSNADSANQRTRIVILGGGFGGVYTAEHLERLTRRRRDDVEVTLVSRDNYFLMTPLLFEAGSGILEPRHAVNPIRPMFDRVRFVEADVLAIDLDARVVTVRLEPNEAQHIEYDQLVLALGGVTNTSFIEGSEEALMFKTLGDAIYLRNHVIQRFELADVERDPQRKQALLTFVVIGAGFVGVELIGELTAFIENVVVWYRDVRKSELRYELIEAGPRIAKEFDEDLSDYAAKILRKRGVNIRVNTKVSRVDIGAGRLTLDSGETIAARTIVVASGVSPSPIVRSLPVQRDQRGRVLVEGTMRSKSRPELWALGDCAEIPDPSGKPYPSLAQHALREARTLAGNILAARDNRPLQPFVYGTKGLLASLGHMQGVGRIYNIRIKGFVAWWVRRTYYLFQMPRWDRRIRIVIDWTVQLFFRNDVVQLDLSRSNEQHIPQPHRNENHSETPARNPSLEPARAAAIHI